jgi:hypothetical protein
MKPNGRDTFLNIVLEFQKGYGILEVGSRITGMRIKQKVVFIFIMKSDSYF